jgi:transcriptional regulator with XRE-family HTH domain
VPRQRPAPFAEEFGRRARTLRLRLRQPSGRRMSIERMAQRAGMDRTTLGRIELGDMVPSLTNVLRLAQALEVDPCDLVAGLRAPLETPR